MPRHAGLRDAQNARQFRDVEPLGGEQAKDAQAHLVPQQPEERGGIHIY